MRNGSCRRSAASRRTFGPVGTCCRRRTTDRSWPAASRSGTRSPGRRPRPPTESATGTGRSTRTYAQHANDRPESPSPPVNLTVPYRELKRLEAQHRTFTGTTARNRDIAARPKRPYGKLPPTRPGEYVILDTTRLDVFGVDPITLRWNRIELTAAMDWYTRCIVGLRLTPVSTKAVDAAAMMFQVYRPPPAPDSWPDYAVWPHHGIPRAVLIDPDQLVTIAGKAASGPSLTPETIVVDHGKIYVSEHLNSVCQRLGISIQPARIREGRDKGPLERFFRTVREGLLQYLPGYKGPDINARGLDVEGHAFFYIDQLEAIVREWIAAGYHHTPHRSLFDKHLPRATMTPVQMFAHGMARAGYIEAPRDPFL